MLAKGKLEYYRFEGAKAMNANPDNSVAVANKTTSYACGTGESYYPGVIDITDTAHGFLAGDNEKVPNFIYIKGTDNYDGLRRIVAVPDANSLYVVAKYVAETLSSGDEMYPGLSFNEPWELVGFKLHLTAAGATTENFQIVTDAEAGASFDDLLYTSDMNGVTDLIKRWDKPIPMAANDIVKCTWANAGSKSWGLTLIAQRLS